MRPERVRAGHVGGVAELHELCQRVLGVGEGTEELAPPVDHLLKSRLRFFVLGLALLLLFGCPFRIGQQDDGELVEVKRDSGVVSGDSVFLRRIDGDVCAGLGLGLVLLARLLSGQGVRCDAVGAEAVGRMGKQEQCCAVV